MQVQGVEEAQVKLHYDYSLTLGTQQCDVLKLCVLRQEIEYSMPKFKLHVICVFMYAAFPIKNKEILCFVLYYIDIFLKIKDIPFCGLFLLMCTVLVLTFNSAAET